MSAENIIKTLENGDAAHTNDTITVQFGGHEWHVKTFIGNYPQAVLLLEGERTPADVADIISVLVRSACVAMAMMSKCSADGPGLLAAMAHEEYSTVVSSLEAARNRRVKN